MVAELQSQDVTITALATKGENVFVTGFQRIDQRLFSSIRKPGTKSPIVMNTMVAKGIFGQS